MIVATNVQMPMDEIDLGRASARADLVRTRENSSLPAIGQQFESILLKQAVEAMMPDPKASVFGGGNAGSMWRSMFADGIAGAMAKTDPLGLAAALDPSGIQSKLERAS